MKYCYKWAVYTDNLRDGRVFIKDFSTEKAAFEFKREYQEMGRGCAMVKKHRVYNRGERV